LESLANCLGGDPRKCQGGLKLGIGLGLRIDQTMDVFFELRTEVFGLFASAKVIRVLATDAGSEFVEPRMDCGAAPTEDGFGLTGGTVTVLEGGFRLKLTTPISSEQFRSRLNGLNDIFRKWCHNNLLLDMEMLHQRAGKW
jgi:hypothetical protein